MKKTISNKNNRIKKKDIIVNYSCYCKKFFMRDDKIMCIQPCCHIVHLTCLNKYLLDIQYNKLNNTNNNYLECPECKTRIKKILTENQILKNKKYQQECIDINSIRFPHNSSINYAFLPINIIKFNSLFNKLINSNTITDILDFNDLLFKSFNIKINIIDNTKYNPIKVLNNKITWLNKVDSKMVIISNHSHDFDPFILFYIFRCGFMVSESINKTDIGKLIASKGNLLVFKRGIDVNVVNKIKEYIEKMKKIIIFPEGTIGNNETLLRFRTGAFYAGVPICPIVIKWRNYIYDENYRNFIFKFITQDEINVDVYINDLFYPPFTPEKIDEVRDFMAKIGNFKKSRVSNRSIKEE